MKEIKTKRVTKFWNVISNDDGDSAEITMYGEVRDSQPRDWWTGEVLDGQYITPEGFAEDLAAIRNKSEVVIKINSCGGDLYTGLAIHNALKGLTGHKTVIIEGIAASAASVIACAGDDVQVYPGSIIMIHGVAALFWDYMMMDDLKKAIRSFDAGERAMAEVYHAKTGIEVATLRSMMSNETWMTGSQAVDKGFADTLLGASGEPEMQLSADKRILLVAGIRHDMRAFHNIPKNIPVIKETNAEPVTAGDKNKTEEVTLMTEQELRAQYPEIIASIEKKASENARTEATAAERARLKEIESIEPMIGDQSLIEKAKYGETPLDAAQLALLSYQQEAKLKAAALGGLQRDAQTSGVAGVSGQPNSGNANDSGAEDEQSLGRMVNAYKSLKGGNA